MSVRDGQKSGKEVEYVQGWTVKPLAEMVQYGLEEPTGLTI